MWIPTHPIFCDWLCIPNSTNKTHRKALFAHVSQPCRFLKMSGFRLPESPSLLRILGVRGPHILSSTRLGKAVLCPYLSKSSFDLLLPRYVLLKKIKKCTRVGSLNISKHQSLKGQKVKSLTHSPQKLAGCLKRCAIIGKKKMEQN